MGAIQSAINSTLNTAAAAAGSIKKIKLDTENLRTEAVTNLPKIEAGIENKAEQIEAGTKKLKYLSKGYDPDSLQYDPANKSWVGSQYLTPDAKTIAYNVKKQESALQSLQGELEGLNMQRERLSKFLKRGRI